MKDIKYEHFRTAHPMEVLDHPQRDLVLKHVKPPILDVGCGNGNILSLLKNLDCVGIDASEIAVKQAKQKGVNAICSTISSFKPKKKFKTIILLDVLPYIADYKSDFKRIIKWLDDDGRILVNLGNKHSLRKVFDFTKKNKSFYYPSYREFKKFVESNGLKIIKAYGGGKLRNFPSFSLSIFYILKKRKKSF